MQYLYWVLSHSFGIAQLWLCCAASKNCTWMSSYDFCLWCSCSMFWLQFFQQTHWQGQSPYDLAKQKKSKWILVQMDLMQKDKGEGKPVFLQSLTRDKVGVVQLIAELVEHSPIIMYNSSNPSSRKNLDVRPYDCTRRYFWHAWSTVPQARQHHGFVL